MARNASPSARTTHMPRLGLGLFRKPGSFRYARLLVAAAAGAAVLTACGGVEIRPHAKLPTALIPRMPAHVGLVIPREMRDFVHNETRWGVEWNVALGQGHKDLMLKVLKDTFAEVKEFNDVEAARAAPGLKAIFEPKIEQYSFVTARETGGRYYAVTIRYRFDLYTPEGEKADSLTLTGYGNSLAKGISSGKPLEQASVAAMRDAAAKFLVQFPEQSVGMRLAKNEPIEVETRTAASVSYGGIEQVPIEEATADAAPAVPAPVSEPSPQPAEQSDPTASPAVPKASRVTPEPGGDSQG